MVRPIPEQRVLSPQEYAALGYVQRSDFDPSMFDVKPDEPLNKPFIDIAYRAESKEEYAMDLGLFLVKLGVAIGTGGLAPVVRVTFISITS